MTRADTGTDLAAVVERVTTPRGELALRRVTTAEGGDHFEVISNGMFLMDTRDGRSERLLVSAALDRHRAPRSVLVGGLGVGFSLQAALADERVAAVDVVEIEPAVVDWHRTHLVGVSGGVLDDRRVTVHVHDVGAHLTTTPASYDVICLDVDNGPGWTVSEANRTLYGDQGTAAIVGRLRPGGVLSVWSAAAAPDYERLLRRHFASVETVEVPVARGEPDVVLLAFTDPEG